MHGLMAIMMGCIHGLGTWTLGFFIDGTRNGMGRIQDIRMELEMEPGIGWDGYGTLDGYRMDIGEFIDRLGKGLLGKLSGQRGV